MRTMLKVSVPFVVAAALVLPFLAATSEPASAVPPCPLNHCSDVLDGFTYVGTCANPDGPGPCVGWIYKRGAETCHVAALGGS